MMDYSEKRQYERKDYQAPVYLSRYESKNQNYDAGVYNYSSGGMCLRSNEKMDVGEQVYVQIRNYDKNVSGPEKYESYTGYVKWSSELGTSSPGGQYGYGVEYAVPVYY